MNIHIKKLTLHNFKGIRSLTIEFADHSRLLGVNASGKTTVLDAWSWLTGGKDSQGRKDFEIKTLDAFGQAIPEIDHEVEGVLLVDGEELTLKKVYREKYTKQRGSAERVFTGHETDYYIDGVPVKQKDYLARVAELGDEDTIKLLTNPAYFNEQLDWKARRQIVLEVGGNVSDEEVIASKSSLSALPSILGKHSIDDYRKIITARRRDINKELDILPARIDEATRSRPEVSGSAAELLAESEELLGRIEIQEGRLLQVRSGGQAVLKEREIVALETELQKIRNEVEGESIQKINQTKRGIQDLELACNRLDSEIFSTKRKVEESQKIAQTHMEKVDSFRVKWKSISEEKLTEIGLSDSCLVCGQPLPAEKVAEAEAKAIEAFNQNRAERLEKVIADGTAEVELANKYSEEARRLLAESEEKKKQLEQKRAELEQVKHELDLLQANMGDASQDSRYLAKIAELKQARESVVNIRETERAEEHATQAVLDGLKLQYREIQAQLSKFEQLETIEKRIEELKAQEKTLSAEYARLERELYLLEEFEKTKVSMMENRINSKFKLARFILFKQHINGGIEPACEVMHNGVPYSSLNTAGRVQVGLDIISTLQRHYDLYAPCWVDNRESVLELPEMACQTVSLIVSAEHRELTVEHVRESVGNGV